MLQIALNIQKCLNRNLGGFEATIGKKLIKEIPVYLQMLDDDAYQESCKPSFIALIQKVV